MRLQKYLSRAGVASRRSSEELISAGRVTVNGHVAELGSSVDEAEDVVCVDGKTIEFAPDVATFVLYKPTGFVTTMDDPQGRPTVKDLIDDAIKKGLITESESKGLFPVGRLDFDTSGLLILTNDGELGARLMHPKFEVDKTYVAKVKGNVSAGELEKLRSGIDLGDFVTEPAKSKLLDKNSKTSTVEVMIHEGKNRQVRRMFKALGHEVVELERKKYGNLTLEGLNKGDVRKLNEAELKGLNQRISVEFS